MPHARRRLQFRIGAGLLLVGVALLFTAGAFVGRALSTGHIVWFVTPGSSWSFGPQSVTAATSYAIELSALLGFSCAFLGEAVLVVTGLEWLVRRRVNGGKRADTAGMAPPAASRFRWGLAAFIGGAAILCDCIGFGLWAFLKASHDIATRPTSSPLLWSAVQCGPSELALGYLLCWLGSHCLLRQRRRLP
jgi:hypothetical protein